MDGKYLGNGPGDWAGRAAGFALHAAVLTAVFLAAPKGEASACHEAYLDENWAAVVKKCPGPAARGDREAQFALGYVYGGGERLFGGEELVVEGVTRDLEQAARWYRLSAEGGFEPAYGPLGAMLDEGEGVPENDKEAAYWYWRSVKSLVVHVPGGLLGFIHSVQQITTAPLGWGKLQDVRSLIKRTASRLRTIAEQGHDAIAQYYIGDLYHHGQGVPKNHGEAVRWFMLAAEQGYASAQYYLGEMHRKGKGVPKDAEEAVRWFMLAAEQGDEDAQFALGEMYRKGKGVPKDGEETVRWYKLAAGQGHAEALKNLGALAKKGHASLQYDLGLMHDNGKGVPENDKEAVRWYGRAAKQGHAPALYSLGLMRRAGQGVSKNLVLAHQWCSLAEAQGHEDAGACRLALEEQMSDKQIAKAQKRASKWKPRVNR